MRIRAENPGFAYGWTKEGFNLWQGKFTIVADGQKVDNAKLFLNFIMDSKTAALISEYTGYGNAIKGSEAFMSAELLAAPEIGVPCPQRPLRMSSRPARPRCKSFAPGSGPI